MGLGEEEKDDEGDNNFMKKGFTDTNYITQGRDFCG